MSTFGFYSDPLGRSRPCAQDRHHDCGHIRAATSRPVSRHRMQSTIFLCRCDCHAACALAGFGYVLLTAWQELCECPGDVKERTWKEDLDNPLPDFAEKERERQERRTARKQAFQAVRDPARGPFCVLCTRLRVAHQPGFRAGTGCYNAYLFGYAMLHSLPSRNSDPPSCRPRVSGTAPQASWPVTVGQTVAGDLAKRGGGNNQGALATFFAGLAREIEADRRTLDRIATRIGCCSPRVPSSPGG